MIIIILLYQDCVSNSTIPADEGGNNVLLKKMALVVEGRPDIDLDLTGTLNLQWYIILVVLAVSDPCKVVCDGLSILLPQVI